jgi:hypothetical protein
MLNMPCKCGSPMHQLGKSGPRKCLNRNCACTEYKGIWYPPKEWEDWIESVLDDSRLISRALMTEEEKHECKSLQGVSTNQGL